MLCQRQDKNCGATKSFIKRSWCLTTMFLRPLAASALLLCVSLPLHTTYMKPMVEEVLFSNGIGSHTTTTILLSIKTRNSSITELPVKSNIQNQQSQIIQITTIAMQIYHKSVSQIQSHNKLKVNGFKQSSNCRAIQLSFFWQLTGTFFLHCSIPFLILPLVLYSAVPLIIRWVVSNIYFIDWLFFPGSFV